MDQVALKVDISVQSQIYEQAVILNRTLIREIGTYSKLPNVSIQAACFYLAWNMQCPLTKCPSLEDFSKRIKLSLKDLSEACQLVVFSVREKIQLVTFEGICERIGWPAINKYAQILSKVTTEAALPVPLKNIVSTQSPVYLAAIVYLTTQMAGIRLACGTICDAAYCQLQQVQKYATQLKAHITNEMNRLEEECKEDFKKIKEEGRQQLRSRKTSKESPQKTIAFKMDIDDGPQVVIDSRQSSRRSSIIPNWYEMHLEHEFGYPLMSKAK